MSRDLTLALSLIVGGATTAVAQGPGSTVPAATLTTAEVREIWAAVLDDYRREKRDTEVDMMRKATRASDYQVGNFRRGGPPRVLRRTTPADAAQDTAWIAELSAAGLIDGVCTDPVISRCPGEYVTLFLTLGAPERAPKDRATVLVRERGVDPAVCRAGAVMMGEFVRLFTVERKSEGWRVRSGKAQGGATLQCRPEGTG